MAPVAVFAQSRPDLFLAAFAVHRGIYFGYFLGGLIVVRAVRALVSLNETCKKRIYHSIPASVGTWESQAAWVFPSKGTVPRRILQHRMTVRR